MMKCPEYADEKLLDAYGELGKGSVNYQRHLRACSGCEKDLAEIRKISSLFHGEAAARPVRSRRIFGWGASVAAALLVSVFLGGTTPSNPPVVEHVGPSTLQPESPVTWEQDETDWDEQIACLQNDIGSLEEELRRVQ